MTENETFNYSDNVSFGSVEIPLSRTARFWLLLLPDIPSTVCAIFALFCFIVDRKARRAIKNHIIIVLLIFGLAAQLIDVPLYLVFIIFSSVTPSTHTTCILWWFVDIGMYNGGTILMAWVSFERHIIVFHDQWISSRRKRLLIHYVPLMTILVYIFAFYIYAICYFPCENAYDYTLPYCSTSPCFQSDPAMGMWDWIVNTALPSFAEPLFSIAFVIRVVWRKYHSQLPIQWRKQRKMAIQLMSLSLLNLITNFPLGILGLAHLIGLSPEIGIDAQQYFFFLCYFVIFTFPFISLASISSVYKRFQEKIFHRRRQLRGLTAVVRPKANNIDMTLHY